LVLKKIAKKIDCQKLLAANTRSFSLKDKRIKWKTSERLFV